MKRSLKSLLLICSWKPLCLGCFSLLLAYWTKVPAFEVLLKIQCRLDSPLVNPVNQTVEEAETSPLSPFLKSFWTRIVDKIIRNCLSVFTSVKWILFTGWACFWTERDFACLEVAPRIMWVYWAFWKSHHTVPLLYFCDNCLLKNQLKFFCKGQGLMYAAGSLQRT